ncbi:MAG: hypothetical protein KBT29_04990, partial [Prevotellaceae bacterium]|nr:hypothetical protein [Candidatus Minthosoma caballi]
MASKDEEERFAKEEEGTPHGLLSSSLFLDVIMVTGTGTVDPELGSSRPVLVTPIQVRGDKVEKYCSVYLLVSFLCSIFAMSFG